MTPHFIKNRPSNKFWLLTSLFLLGIFYLNLIWRGTNDLDKLTTNSLFFGAIFFLIWRRKESIKIHSDLFSSFIGLSLLVIVIIKAISLSHLELNLLPLFPFFAGICLALIASTFQGLGQYIQELFLAGFLFLPEDVIGFRVNNLVKVADITAYFSSYFLYYLGFDVTNQENEIMLSLPNVGEYQAIVNYSCTGIPMILLMLKLSLLLISFFSLKKSQYFSIPIVSIAIGFLLGVVRVCLMTLAIPEPAIFNYWHGAEGSQIFSTLAIVIFSGWAYWILNRDNLLEPLEPD